MENQRWRMRICEEKNISYQQKENIIKLYTVRRKQNTSMNYMKLISLISQECEIPESFVRNTIYVYNRSIEKMSSSHKKIDNQKKFTGIVDNLKKSEIRKKIHNIWFVNKIPTLERIMSSINCDQSLPRYNKVTLCEMLSSLNFEFTELSSGRRAAIEKNDIVRWRRNYLENIRKYREEGRPIYFIGEISFNIVNNLNSQDTQIIAHIGSVDGFVPEGLMSIQLNESLNDYQNKINETLTAWFKSVLTLLKENAVVVMNDDFHNKINSKIKYPNMTWKNADIIEWLISNGQAINKEMTKVQLIDLVNQIISANSIDNYAKYNNKTILQIPPYHCELNAIELAWNMVKCHVERNLTSTGLIIFNLITEGLDMVTPKEWYSNIKYITELEEANCWKLDLIVNKICDDEPSSPIGAGKQKIKVDNDQANNLLTGLSI